MQISDLAPLAGNALDSLGQGAWAVVPKDHWTVLWSERMFDICGLPNRLELEITEGVLMQNDPATVTILHQLKALGVRIALDDFGTGYSSLSYLRSFPFDKIKIDRSFVADMESRADAAAIVRAVAGLGTSLGMTTTAEGIETQAQLDRLRADGCTQVQGFLLSRPLDALKFLALLSKGHGNRLAA